MFKLLNKILKSKLLKNKWNILSIIFFICIFYIIYKYYKTSKYKKKIILNNNNNYLESKGQISTFKNVSETNTTLLKNSNSKNTEIKTNINNIKKSYYPVVIKISNIIIGRYDIGKLNKEHSKLLINIIYQNVNKCIFSKYKSNQINDIITDSYKFNELVDNVTLIVSRILFKVIEDPLTKILIGQYIIKKTDNNKEIDEIYLYFINISKNTRLSVDIRMNAIDILNLSNNKKYIEVSKSLLQTVRNNNNSNNNTTLTFNNNLNRISNIVKNKPINNLINNNNVNNTNVIQTNIQNRPQLLVDMDGTTYPIPPDINVPPLQTRQIVEVKKPERSIYDDSQNVHNTTINQSTLNTANELINRYDPQNRKLDFVYYKTKSFSELPPEQIEKVEKSIHRINTDTSTFGKDFTLYTIYQSLLNLIDRHPQKDDLNERLLDELIDMSGKCSTGHLSRLINVLQGFETDLQVKVKININDEIYAKIKHLIEQSVINDDKMDEIMEDMLSEDKTIYINFVKKVINNNIIEIVKEYDNVNVNDIVGYKNEKKLNNIRDIVVDIVIISLDKYTGTKEKFNYLLNGK